MSAEARAASASASASTSSSSSSSSSRSSSSSSSSFIPKIPAPLQRLFDSVPLITYSPNELPAGGSSARNVALPILHVFTTEEDAVLGLPSFNPSCLKWQAYLRLHKVPHITRPSNNHASPSGSLPFILPPNSSTPIPSSSFRPFVLKNGTPASSSSPTSSSQEPPPPHPQSQALPTSSSWGPRRYEAYLSLLDHRIRPAWLYTLYLDRANTTLLHRLYAGPASRSPIVQRTLIHQLRRAARAEILASTAALSGGGSGGVVDREALYAGARTAFAALETVLSEEGGESAWYEDRAGPGMFDASVFAYTHLLLDASLGWGDRSLGLILEAQFPRLVRHRARMLERCWGDEGHGKGGRDIADSATWEKI